MELFENDNNTSDIIVKAYGKHMLKYPMLQDSEILNSIGIKWDDHRKIMENESNLECASSSVNAKILSKISDAFKCTSKNKLYLLIAEMSDYGYSLHQIAKALKADPEKLGIFYDEFSAMILHYKAIGCSINRINKLSHKETKKIYL